MNGGRGHGGRGQRNSGRGRGGSSRNNHGSSVRSVTAKGNCVALGDAIFTCGDDKQSERFDKTREKIMNHIFANFEQGKYIKESLEKLEVYDIELWRPEEVEDPDDMGEVEKMILQQEVRDYIQRRTKFEENMYKAFALILGQCTVSLKNKLENRKDWKVIEDKGRPHSALDSNQRDNTEFSRLKISHSHCAQGSCGFFWDETRRKRGIASLHKEIQEFTRHVGEAFWKIVSHRTYQKDGWIQ